MMLNSPPILELGEKLHIITRRNFSDDLRRHFVGEITALSPIAMRLKGYTFVFNPTSLEYRRRDDLRTRVFAIADAQLIINVLPPEVRIERLQYRIPDGQLVLMDGAGYSLDINEFNATHKGLGAGKTPAASLPAMNCSIAQLFRYGAVICGIVSRPRKQSSLETFRTWIMLRGQLQSTYRIIWTRTRPVLPLEGDRGLSHV